MWIMYRSVYTECKTIRPLVWGHHQGYLREYYVNTTWKLENLLRYCVSLAMARQTTWSIHNKQTMTNSCTKPQESTRVSQTSPKAFNKTNETRKAQKTRICSIIALSRMLILLAKSPNRLCFYFLTTKPHRGTGAQYLPLATITKRMNNCTNNK